MLKQNKPVYHNNKNHTLMKKILFILSLVICTVYCAYSQTPSVYTFYYLETPPCYLPSNNIWKTSHGSPCYATHPWYPNSGYYNYMQFEATRDSSEGIFTEYTFSANNKYKIEVVLKEARGTPTIFLYAANNLSEQIDTKCNLGSLPYISDKAEIGHDYASCGALNETCSVTIPETNSYWKPNKNYNQFWVYSNSNDMTAFVVEKITITECVSNTLPMPKNLRTTSIEAKKITVQWDPLPSSTGVVGYELYLNGNSKGSVTGTGFSFTGLTGCTSYTIGVRAFDRCDNYSPIASITAQTAADLPFDIVLERPIDLSTQPNKKYLAQALNTVTLKPGFSVKANATQEIFHAKISTGCGDIISKNTPQSEEEFYFIEDDDFSMNFPSEMDYLTFPSNAPNSDLLIYPNPTSNMITVEYHQFTGVEKITIFDIMGKSLLDHGLSGVVSDIDISAFSAGIYFIRIITDEQVFVRKLVKQ